MYRGLVDNTHTSSFRAEVGQHAVVLENGIVRVLFAGRVSMDDARQISEIVIELSDAIGVFPAIVDLDGLADFDSGARTVFARPVAPFRFSAVAYFGGNFASRTLIQTIVRAGKIVSPKSFDFDVRGFATESEARRFLEKFVRKNQVGT